MLAFSFLHFDAGKVKRGAFAAGRKITRIISFSKKKSPRPGDPRVSYSNPRQGQPWALLSLFFGVRMSHERFFYWDQKNLKTTRSPGWLRISCQSAGKLCVRISKWINVLPTLSCRLPVPAGEPNVAGAVVLRVSRRSAFLSRQRRRSDLHALCSPARLRGGSGSGTQASFCLQNPTEQHGGGCSGGKIRDYLW